jgi:hypothetical protein
VARLGEQVSTGKSIRGTLASRAVQLFSSNPGELAVSPRGKFTLMANALNEVGLVVRPGIAGPRRFFVNVVDTEFGTLLCTYLVAVNVAPPVVTKSFALTLPLEKTASKRVSFRNPYSTVRTFSLSCDRRDLVHFKEDRLLIPSGDSRFIAMQFAPHHVPGVEEVLVFVNDDAGKCEECFMLKVAYTEEMSVMAASSQA